MHSTHQTLTFMLQLAKLPNLPDAHLRITDDGRRGVSTNLHPTEISLEVEMYTPIVLN